MAADLVPYLHAAGNGGLSHTQLLEIVGLDPNDRASLTDRLLRMGADATAEALIRVYRADNQLEQERVRRLVMAYADPATMQVFTGTAGRNVPEAFWDARPQHEIIRQAAWSKSSGGDAMLGAVLARLAWMIPPSVHIVMQRLKPATLDLYVSLVGASGTGKTTAAELARDLLSPDPRDKGLLELPLGSGEGMIESYFETISEPDPNNPKKWVKVKQQTRRGILYSLDEGAVLKELAARKGSTILQAMRTMWTGSLTGQSNAGDGNSRRLLPRSYRVALISGWQPDAAAHLLADAHGGTPQRFVWFAAEDPRIPDDGPEWPGTPLFDPEIDPRLPIGVSAAIEREIRSERLSANRGEVVLDNLDSHRTLSRLKVAALLALLDCRTVVEGEDWALADLLMVASDAVRQGVVDLAAAQQAAELAAQAERTARIATTVRHHVEEDTSSRALEACGRAFARYVHRHPPGTVTKGDAARTFPGRHRKAVETDEALDYALGMCWIVLVPGDPGMPDTYHPTGTMP